MALIINEDNAVKQKLMGMTVADERNPSRPVKVYFSQPDSEITEQTYPYATIDLIDIAYDPDRAHSGYVGLPYQPEGWPTLAAGKSYVVEYPIPLSLYYQATFYSRHPRHDRQIKASMLHHFPYKFGGVYVAEDDTIRTAALVQFRDQSVTENGKRLFKASYTIRVFSEMLPSVARIVGQTAGIVLTMPDIAINTTVPQP